MGLLEGSWADVLMKVVMFMVVQALVYLILCNSSDVFDKNKKMRSLSFKRARSVSIRRILNAISDLPQGGEASPSSSRGLRSPTLENPRIQEHDQ
ncbi:hypothetical protein CCACVL1_17468 [Corchorus capsularis]|uniref:Uncharacterized protein n=1 Tax=Corchorus capsularis TaxID=210143 RepID=A0A1R3HSD3_COCAP|nr:hypothetical protein CCACVL1_17468 [Corchorus capsularis]